MQAKSIIAGLLCVFCSNALYAEYDVSNLQKLFTDKKQRAQIDAARSGNYADSEPQKTRKVSVLGYVTRTGGKSVAWVNNRSTLEKSRVGDINVHQASIGASKKVSVTVDGVHIKLKPGESWSKETGKIVDNQK